MKSSILRTFLIVMLLVSSAAFGAIQTLGPGADSYAEASASGSSDYVYDPDSGWYFEYTDIGATCGWSWTVYAEAEARATLMLDKYASATAVADVDVTGVATDHAFQSASVSGTGTYNGEFLEDDPEEPDSNTNSDDGQVEQYYGIYGDSVALAIASIDEGSNCWAYAEATAYADVELHD